MQSRIYNWRVIPVTKEEASISIDDFMALDDAKTVERTVYSDEDYLAQLSSKVARNAAFISEELGVTPYTVARRLLKLSENILIRFDGNEAYYVLKPEPKPKGKGKKGKGVQL